MLKPWTGFLTETCGHFSVRIFDFIKMPNDVREFIMRELRYSEIFGRGMLFSYWPYAEDISRLAPDAPWRKGKEHLEAWMRAVDPTMPQADEDPDLCVLIHVNW